MCIIIIKDNDKFLEDDMLMKSATLNPHGLGVTWLDDFTTEFGESTDWHILRTTRPYIAHFRYATVGKICKENNHPFEIGDTGCLLYQNGSVYNLGNKEKTDTQHMAEILGRTDQEYWGDILEMTDCRWVIVYPDTEEYEVFNESQWIERNDVLYSKRNVLDNQLVAVYGTLREGYGNNYLLKNSQYLGTGKTYDKYPMVANGIPFVLPQKGKGHHITVDLYLVDKMDLMSLDQLEGHPNWYKRTKTGIVVGDNYTEAWLYFNDQATDDGVYYSDYELYRQPTQKSYMNVTYSKTSNDDYGFQCNKCGNNETIYDEYAGLDWCFDCNDYVNHNYKLYDESEHETIDDDRFDDSYYYQGPRDY